MSKLTTNFLGFEMENPWCVASGPSTATARLISEAFDAGWAGAVIKTIGPENETITNFSPRIQSFRKDKRLIAFQNIELVSDRKLSVWLEELAIIRQRYPRKMLIASIMAAGDDLAGWCELLEKMEMVGCDAIELNLGCPHGMPERGMGAICSQDPDIVYNITRACKQAANTPILVKLSPNVTNIKPMAEAVKRAGGDAIVVINTVSGIIGVDIENATPLMSLNGMTAIGGLSGPAVKPIGLRCVAECIQASGMPISGVGGISTWQDSVEYLLMGASQLQVCSEIMASGFGIIEKMKTGLLDYLDRHEHTAVNDLVGDLWKRVRSFGELYEGASTNNVVIDEELCIGCGTCHTVCNDAGYKALHITDRVVNAEGKSKKVAKLRRDYCTGCNLCVSICPVTGCMKLKDSGKSFPYEPHDDYSGISIN